MSTSKPRGTRSRLAALATAAALALTGCSGEEPSPAEEAEPSASLLEPSGAPTFEVEPVTTSGTIVGRLPRTKRAQVERAVSRVVVRWLGAAYLRGDYPRRRVGNAFPGFTPGARAAARRDAGLMTNQRIARRTETVTPTAVRVEVDLLAVHKRAVSATAHVLLRFRAEGRTVRAHRVQGRLLLTRGDGGWQVFAYDVARSHDGGPARGKQDKQDKRGKKDKRDQQGNKDRSKKTKKKDKQRPKGDRG